MIGIQSLDARAQAVLETLRTRFSDAGFELALVGGTVRDLLCGKTPGDIDLCTNATPDEFEPLLAGIGSIYAAGRLYGTLAVSYGNGEAERVEITSYRTEGYDSESRKPSVMFTTSLEEDLSRRDFTLNAIALDLITGRLVDPFDGEADLVAGVLKTPRDPVATMMDDPLRGVRAVRFAAQRGWEISTEVADAIYETRERLAIVSRERVNTEIVKIFSSADAVSVAVAAAERCGISKAMFGVFSPRRGLVAHTTEKVAGVVPTLTYLAVCNELHPHDARRELLKMKLPVAVADGVAQRLYALDQAYEVRDQYAARRFVRRFGPGEVLWEVRNYLPKRSREKAEIDAVLTEDRIFEKIPVDGHDMLSLGLVGPSVGEALRLIEDELCRRGTISREEAFELAQSVVEAERASA